MIVAIFTVLFLCAVGWPVAALLECRPALRLADDEGRRAEARPTLRIAEAYLLGGGIAAGVLFGMSLLHLAWSRAALVAVLVVIAIAAAALARKRLAVAWPPLPHPIDGLTALFVAGYARFATIGPSPESDFVTIWGLKAKAFAFAHGIDWRFLENPFNQFAHVDYPPLVSLLFDVQALIAGAWPGQWLGVVHVAFGVALLLVVRAFLEDLIPNKAWRAAATFAFVSAAFSPWLGLAEGPIAAYGTVGLLFLRRRNVARGAVYLGLAACCKNEGLTLIVAAAIAMLIAGEWRRVARLWPAVVIAAPWVVLRSMHHLQTDLTTSGMGARTMQHLQNLRPMIAAMMRYPLGRPLMWIGIAGALAVGIVYVVTRERFLTAAIAIQIAFFIGAYLVTPHDVTWHVRWSWERIVSQLTPAIVFLAMTAIADRVLRCTRILVQ